MMKINGFNGTNTQTGAMGMAQANDSVSKNIQNQIANAQQKLQDLSSNEELSLEDKMKKRQEIQQEITNLNQQLRQHQIEQRKEQQSKKSSMDDMVAEKDADSNHDFLTDPLEIYEEDGYLHATKTTLARLVCCVQLRL